MWVSLELGELEGTLAGLTEAKTAKEGKEEEDDEEVRVGAEEVKCGTDAPTGAVKFSTVTFVVAGENKTEGVILWEILDGRPSSGIGLEKLVETMPKSGSRLVSSGSDRDEYSDDKSCSSSKSKPAAEANVSEPVSSPETSEHASGSATTTSLVERPEASEPRG